MELSCRFDTVRLQKVLYDGTVEQSIETEHLLPDYCPSIFRILRQKTDPHITSLKIAGSRLMIEGICRMEVLYTAEESFAPCSITLRQRFERTVELKDAPKDSAVTASVRCDYINCRAVSPRRVEVRAGFTVHACAERAQTIELPCAAAQARLYTKGVTRTVTAPLVAGEKLLTVNETLAFDSGLPAAEQLLGGECTAAVSEVKLLTDKAIVKGQIYLHQLYTDDSVSGTTYVLEYTVPFSVIMDVEGVRDGQLHTAQVSVLSDTEECVAGEGGQNSALGFTAKLLVQLFTYEKAAAQLVTDAFHPDCPVTLSDDTLSLCSLTEALRQSATVQKSVALPSDGLREIVDAWVMPMPTVGRVENGRIELNAPMLLSLLVRDADGVIAYYERVEDFRVEWLQAVSCDETAVSVKAYPTVMGMSYAAIGDKLDLRLTLAISCELWETAHERVVRDITLQSENAYPVGKAAMRLYYADAGESVWDIARRCHTSPDAVREENDLRDEVLSAKTVLLIPSD